jgi:GcrA cell cycle regulator
VVGKVHRLNLPPRPSPIKRGDGAAPKGQNLEKRRKSTSPAQPVNKALLAVMCEADLPNVVQMVRKVGDKPCAWPMGDPRLPGFHFCNDLALDGKPYCQAHGQIAFVRPGNNRKDAA